MRGSGPRFCAGARPSREQRQRGDCKRPPPTRDALVARVCLRVWTRRPTGWPISRRPRHQAARSGTTAGPGPLRASPKRTSLSACRSTPRSSCLDSARLPLPVGVRSAGATPRQLVYETERRLVKLQIETIVERLVLLGQIIDKRDPTRAFQNLPVLVRNGQETVDRTTANSWENSSWRSNRHEIHSSNWATAATGCWCRSVRNVSPVTAEKAASRQKSMGLRHFEGTPDVSGKRRTRNVEIVDHVDAAGIPPERLRRS